MLITHAQLNQTGRERLKRVEGAEMAQLPGIPRGWLYVRDGKIAGYGPMPEEGRGGPGLAGGQGRVSLAPLKPEALQSLAPEAIRSLKAMAGETPPPDTPQHSARGGLLLPSFCDSHTHLVFARGRETEFVDRIKGLSYEEIARRGGGILNSAQRLRETSEDELFESALERLKEVIHLGTGAIEIKSGYGLDYDEELKMLRVVARLKERSPIPVKATFLGAHAVPAEYKTQRKAYVDLICQKMLPDIAQQHLADYIDVFCDRGFFTPEETVHILQEGKKHGLRPKIHANELDYSGGIQAGVACDALSVDHLEYTGPDEIKVLQGSGTMPTLLPGTAYFLRLPHYPPARTMIDAGLGVALATDYNPGSCPSGRMGLVLSLACTQMNMLPNETINAATLNGAYAMDLSGEMGSLDVGKRAHFMITEPLPGPESLPYYFGRNWIKEVWLGGRPFTGNF